VLPSEHLVDHLHVAEQVGDDAVMGLALDIVEQHRTAAVHVLLQAGDFEVGIDRFVGLDQVPLPAQPVERGAQISRMVRLTGGGFFLAQYLLHGWDVAGVSSRRLKLSQPRRRRPCPGVGAAEVPLHRILSIMGSEPKPCQCQPAAGRARRAAGSTISAGVATLKKERHVASRRSTKGRSSRTPEFPPTESSGYLVRDTHRAFQRLLERRIAAYGVTRGQWYFLRVLWNEDGLTQRELSARVGMMEPTTVIALRSMEKSGLIRRRRSTDDKRRSHVWLT